MTFAQIHAHALGHPAAHVVRQWGDAHVYKVAGKVFAIEAAGRDRISPRRCWPRGTSP
ncbi:hypothetical protein [Oceanibium sediminis]|uniref:hypothetical protein n=1 Tax=Oceanibium sediminis TaxID=2026339 RepID=UPI0018E4FA41|nr:hypothetical protein [Oceanibium sediminis]